MEECTGLVECVKTLKGDEAIAVRVANAKSGLSALYLAAGAFSTFSADVRRRDDDDDDNGSMF